MSDFGFLGAFAGKVSGKVVNAANSSQELMCLGKCDKITKHINISYADSVTAAGGIEETIGSIVGTLSDLVPAVYPLVIGNPYACTCCNKIRFHGGALSIRANEYHKSSYLKKK